MLQRRCRDCGEGGGGGSYCIKKEMSPSKNSIRGKKEVRRLPLCSSSVALFCRDVGMIIEL